MTTSSSLLLLLLLLLFLSLTLSFSGSPGGGGNDLHMFNLNTCLTAWREVGYKEGIRWVLFPDLDEFFLPVDNRYTLSQVGEYYYYYYYYCDYYWLVID